MEQRDGFRGWVLPVSRLRQRTVGLGYWLLVALVSGLLRLLGWRVTVTGAEHLPRDGGAVLTWAHTSHLDFVVTALAVWRATGRPCRLLAMEELWSSPTLGWIPRAARAIPVERSDARGRVTALRHAASALEDGDLVLLAPEGTISTSFEVLPMRSGAVRLAQRAGVPLVPSASWGTHRVSTTGHGPRVLGQRGLPIDVAFGPPVEVMGVRAQAATAELGSATEQLLHGLQERYADGTPSGAWWVPARLGGGAPDHASVLATHRPGQALTEGGVRGWPRGRAERLEQGQPGTGVPPKTP